MTVDDLLRGTPLHHGWLRALFRRVRWIVILSAGLTVFSELTRPTRSSWQDPLIYLALPAYLLAVAFSVGWPARPRALRHGSDLTLRFAPGWRYGVRGLLILPLAGLMVVVLPKAPAEPIASSIMVFFFVATVALAIVIPRESFRVTGAGVDRISPWTGRMRSLRWQEVAKVEVDGSRRLVMRGQRATLKVPLTLEGAGDFAAQAVSLLPAHVVDAGANVRPLLEAVAARLEAAVEGHAATAPRLPRPQPVALVAVLVAIGGGVWAYSMKLETPLRVPIPDGWVDLSPGVPEGKLAEFPPTIRELARLHGVVALAAERPAEGIAEPDQLMVVHIRNGEMDVAAAERHLASESAKKFPNARVVSQHAETIRGIRSVRAEVAFDEGTAIVYAVPVIARTSIVVFTCAAMECARVRQTAAATVSAIDGLAEPTFRNRYAGPLIRSGAMLVIYAAVFVGILAFEATVHRRRPSRPEPRPRVIVTR